VTRLRHFDRADAIRTPRTLHRQTCHTSRHGPLLRFTMHCCTHEVPGTLTNLLRRRCAAPAPGVFRRHGHKQSARLNALEGIFQAHDRLVLRDEACHLLHDLHQRCSRWSWSQSTCRQVMTILARAGLPFGTDAQHCSVTNRAALDSYKSCLLVCINNSYPCALTEQLLQPAVCRLRCLRRSIAAHAQLLQLRQGCLRQQPLRRHRLHECVECHMLILCFDDTWLTRLRSHFSETGGTTAQFMCHEIWHTL